MEGSDLFLYAAIVVAALVLWIAVKVVKKVMVALLVTGVMILLAAALYFNLLK